jgi:hypothetical protein
MYRPRVSPAQQSCARGMSLLRVGSADDLGTAHLTLPLLESIFDTSTFDSNLFSCSSSRRAGIHSPAGTRSLRQVPRQTMARIQTRTVTVPQPVTSLNVRGYAGQIQVTAAPVTHVQVTETIAYFGRPPAVVQSVSGGRPFLADPACANDSCSVSFTVKAPPVSPPPYTSELRPSASGSVHHSAGLNFLRRLMRDSHPPTDLRHPSAERLYPRRCQARFWNYRCLRCLHVSAENGRSTHAFLVDGGERLGPPKR